jgi:hypothetical protein
MAHQQTVVFIDDLDGSEAVRTVAFSLDGQQYEIDLSTQNLQRLRDALAPFAAKARRVRVESAAAQRARQERPRRDEAGRDEAGREEAGREEAGREEADRGAAPAQVAARPAPAGPSVSAPPAARAGTTKPKHAPPGGGSSSQVPVSQVPSQVPVRPPVPAAVFSEPAEPVMPHRTSPPKTQLAAVFSPAT